MVFPAREVVAQRIGIPRNLWPVLTVNDAPGALDTTSAVEAVASWQAGDLFLVLAGPAGTGKTTAAANWLWRRRHVEGALFIRAAEVRRLNWFDSDAVARVLGAPLLVCDDLGAELSGSDWPAKVDELISRRDADESGTIVTTNLVPDQLRATLGARAMDRITGRGRIVECVGPSLRQKKGQA